MKNQTIYLKESNVLWNSYHVFDLNNWTRLSVSEGAIHFQSYDDIDDFNNGLEIYQVKCYNVTREEFNEFYKLQSEELNLITKEL